jgi:hypothetical protein
MASHWMQLIGSSLTTAMRSSRRPLTTPFVRCRCTGSRRLGAHHRRMDTANASLEPPGASASTG